MRYVSVIFILCFFCFFADADPVASGMIKDAPSFIYASHVLVNGKFSPESSDACPNKTGFDKANCLCSSGGNNHFPQRYKVGGATLFAAVLQGNPSFESMLAKIKPGTNIYQMVWKDNAYILNESHVVAQIPKDKGMPLKTFFDPLAHFKYPITSDDKKVLAWTGFTPTGTYNVDAIGNPSPQINNYWSYMKKVIACHVKNIVSDCLPQITTASESMIQTAINQIVFSCGKFTNNDYTNAISWATTESYVNIKGKNKNLALKISGVYGEANNKNGQGVNDPSGTAGWGFRDPKNAPGMCNEYKSFYCIYVPLADRGK